MDGLSVAASVIAIWQLTIQVIGYLSDVNDAPKECKQCVTEASNLLGPLIELRYLAEQAQTRQSSDPWFEQLKKLNVEDGPLDQYKQALELLRTRVETRDGIQKLKRRLLWKFDKEEVASILARMERLKSLVSIALEMDHRTLSDAIKDDTTFIRASLPPLQARAVAIEAGIDTLQTATYSMKDDTVSIRNALPPLQASSTAVRDAQSLQHHQAVIEWLSPTDFPAQQHDIISRRQDGTARWFLDSVEFTNWLQGPDKMLFCPGIPGAGKTMMAAVAIDYLCRTTRSDEVGIAYLFCSYKVQVDQSAPNLLAAILKQLVQSRPGIEVSVKALYDRHSKRETKPSLDELTQSLLSICSSYPIVYVVTDALDECSNINGVRRQLIDRLRSLQANSRNVRLLFTSRFIPEVTEDFQSSPWLEVRASEEDVRRYVAGQIPRLPKCIQRDEGLKNDVQSKIVEAVEGMFLLARLHVDSLLDKRNKQRVLSTLDKLTKGSTALENAYGDAIKRIDGQLDEDKALAKRAICWISYAQRPLTTKELCCALAIEPGDKALNVDNVYEAEDIVSICAGLVTIDRESSIIRLVHYTMQEYFERERQKWNPDALEEIAVACLTYLSFETFKGDSCTSDKTLQRRLAENQFLDYSARYWGQHVRPVESSVTDLALAFLCQKALLDCTIQVVCSLSYKYAGYLACLRRRMTRLHITAGYGLLYLTQRLLSTEDEDNIGVDQEDGFARKPLHYAAESGHELVIKLLLESGADVNAQNGNYGNALLAASAGGHEQVVKLLLESGADVNAQGGRYDNPLQAASAGGHEQVVKLLLERGADVHAQGGYYGNTLQAASARGHEQVVRLLLERGADVNAQGGEDHGSALQAASYGGREQIVKLLLERGADVNAQGGRCDNALQAASARGHEQVVKLLLERGADVNAQGGEDHGSALQAASAGGYEQIVKLLLESGADVNAQGGYYGNTLQAASACGDEQVVRLLLESGADVNAQGRGEYSSALQAASGGGHEYIVNLLLERGADVNAQGGYYGNTLQAASAGGYEQIVKLLLERGADVNAQGGEDHGSALQAASEGGYEYIVKLLLERGADVNAQGGYYGNTLQAASAGGYEQIVKLLLESGADVNAQGGYYGNTLQAASHGGHEQVVRLLLDSGADVNAQGGGNYGSALQVASARGYEQLVRLLLESGADVNAQGRGEYSSALQAASDGGHKYIVKLLLESGADVNAQDGRYDNALQAASASGHEQVVTLLVGSR